MYEVKRFSIGDNGPDDHLSKKQMLALKLAPATVAVAGATGVYKSTVKKTEDSDKLLRALMDEAKSKGYVVDTNSPLSKVGSGGVSLDLRDKLTRSVYDTATKSGKLKYNDALLKAIKEGRPYVGLSIKSPSILAHEMGHNMSNDHIVGKATQNVPVSVLASSSITKLGTLGAAFKSGMNKSKEAHGDGEESKLSKNVSWAAPLALSSPTLVSEFEASRRGINELKRLGASPKSLSKAKKELALAGLTYAGSAGSRVSGGLISRELGRRYQDWKYNKDKESES